MYRNESLILSSAVSEIFLTSIEIDDEIVTQMISEKVVSVIRQCDNNFVKISTENERYVDKNNKYASTP